MADLRFKISGTSLPFTAGVYSLTNELVQEQLVESPAIETPTENHTCVIFSNLQPVTSYYIKLTDGVGATSQSPTIVTEDNPAGYVNTKNIQMLGVVYTIPTTLCTKIWQPQSVPDGKGGKCIRFDPELEIGECVRVNLCAYTDQEDGNDTTVVTVYKRTSPTASYSVVENVDDDTCNFNVDIGAGETVCYASSLIMAARTSGSYEAETCLKIINNVTSIGSTPINEFTCGPEVCIGSTSTCSVATTTTTTSNTPYKVYFSRPLQGTTTCKPSQSAKLAIDPPLPDGGIQKIRVHFYLETHYEHLGDLQSYLCECSRIYKSSTDVNAVATDSRKDASVNITKNCSYSRIIDARNIDDYTFSVCSIDCLSNDTVNHSTYACLCICKLDQGVGGSYSFGGTMPAFGTQGISVETDVFAPYVPPEKFDRFVVKPDPDGPVPIQ